MDFQFGFGLGGHNHLVWFGLAVSTKYRAEFSFSLVSFDLVWFGLVWIFNFGLAVSTNYRAEFLFSLVSFDLVWFGLVCIFNFDLFWGLPGQTNIFIKY